LENCLNKDLTFNRVYQPLKLSAKLKSCAKDFVVEEQLSVEFTGDGEHCWIYLQKQDCNTDWVAQQLARYCQVKPMAVSYAGLKDRHAVTSQWFSVQLPGKPTPDWQGFEVFFSQHRYSSGSSANRSVDNISEVVKVLQSFRHNRKLQRGALKGNVFKITLREISDCSNKMFECLTQRCEQIATAGVPNYFGEQRFGRNRNNLDQALKLFSTTQRSRLSKHKRGLYLSAARSWLFNLILSERIKQNNWDKRIVGDAYMLDGKSACFKEEPDLDEDALAVINSRLARHEIHPTAVMWGEDENMVTQQAAELEKAILNLVPAFRDGLVAARLQAQRRACRVIPGQMQCARQGDDLVVSFSLPAGSYATEVLAEIFSDLS